MFIANMHIQVLSKPCPSMSFRFLYSDNTDITSPTPLIRTAVWRYIACLHSSCDIVFTLLCCSVYAKWFFSRKKINQFSRMDSMVDKQSHCLQINFQTTDETISLRRDQLKSTISWRWMALSRGGRAHIAERVPCCFRNRGRFSWFLIRCVLNGSW